MTPRAGRMAAVGRTTAGSLAILALVAACAGHPRAPAAKPSARAVHAQPTSSTRQPAGDTPQPTSNTNARSVPARAVAAGTAGTYQVGQRRLTFTEPARTGPTGQHLTRRTLLIDVRYPHARRTGGPGPARGPFPLIMFAPGFLQCDSTYADLLRYWAGAGYVVAAVNFPRTDCRVGAAADESDLVNQPGDMSYALSRLLRLSARPGNPLSGLLDSRRIAAAGQSDGGDTVAALAANTCCTDHRLAAVAVLSGAEWPPMPGRYFPGGAPPMLFTQGSADIINPPWTSVQLYTADRGRTRYYLDLFGATHMVPYSGTNRYERIVARVTLAFFDRYVLGEAGALATMRRHGNVRGTAVLVSDGRLPPA